MGQPHKHAEVIKAWADGKAIEWKHPAKNFWQDAASHPNFYPDIDYRVKPQEMVDYTLVMADGIPGATFRPKMLEILNWYANFTSVTHCPGYIKRTRVDGVVTSMEFIPR